MSRTDRNKRVGSFLAFAAVIALLLLLFPTMEEWIRVYLKDSYGLIVDAESGNVSTTSGISPHKITVTTTQIIFYLLLILKIVLWMALVIGFVRFFRQVITKALY